MHNIPKKYIIKIPNDISIFYCSQKKIIMISGPLRTKSLKLKLKILFLNSQNSIAVTNNAFQDISKNQKKKLKALQGTTTALLKQSITETSSILYQKLKLVGVGYRTFDVEHFENTLLMFKLGYSHALYFKIPAKLNIFCLKLTKLFIFGNCFKTITQTASTIRSYKKPEPYKGKGILYENEKIILKEGKKI